MSNSPLVWPDLKYTPLNGAKVPSWVLGGKLEPFPIDKGEIAIFDSMRTIFDYEPTIEELEALFQLDKGRDTICHCLTTRPFPVSEYRVWTNERVAAFDIGLLLDYRGERRAAAYWFAKAPEIWEEYKATLLSLNK